MCSQRNPEKLPDRFARTLNDRLGRSHAELRAAVRLAGTRIVKLNFGRKDDPVLELQRRVLRDAREVVKQQKELQWTDPKPMPDEAAEAPEAPLTQESGTKLIREELDRDRAYFKFAKEQAKDDRDLFKHHLDITVRFLTIIIFVVIGLGGFFGYRTFHQIQEEAKLQTAQELVSIRAEVRKRIDDEFKTENITKLVRDVAKEFTETRSKGVIATEVGKAIQAQTPMIRMQVETQTKQAVKDLQPLIHGIVTSTVDSQVLKSVEPLQTKLKETQDLLVLDLIVMKAKSGSMEGFYQLIGIMRVPGPLTEVKKLATMAFRSIIADKNNTLRLSRRYLVPQTPDAVKEMLSSGIAEQRLTAIDNFPESDLSILPLLVKIVNTDDNLDVVVAAFKRFSRTTKQNIEFPDRDGLNYWWSQNKDKFK